MLERLRVRSYNVMHSSRIWNHQNSTRDIMYKNMVNLLNSPLPDFDNRVFFRVIFPAWTMSAEVVRGRVASLKRATRGNQGPVASGARGASSEAASAAGARRTLPVRARQLTAQAKRKGITPRRVLFVFFTSRGQFAAHNVVASVRCL